MAILFLILVLLSRFNPLFAISGGFKANTMLPVDGVVLIDNVFGIGLPPFCTGALLSHRIVLTNGNCCYDSMNRTTIYAGSMRPFESGEMYRPERYELIGNAHSTHYKLCVIKVDRDIQFHHNLVPLGLPLVGKDAIYADSQLLYTMGFGSTQLDPATDPEQAKVQNLIYQREMSDQMMAIELPLLAQWKCEGYYEKVYTAPYDLVCMGFRSDRTKRLMFDDNGAPVVGVKDRIVYGIAATYPALKPGNNWQTTSFPHYAIDVQSATPDILRAMKTLMED